MRRLVALLLVCGACTAVAEAPETSTSIEPASTTAPTTTGATVETTGPIPTTPPTVPSDADFYSPPDPLPDGSAGDVIWAEPMSAPDGVSAWLVLYQSVAVSGDPIAVSGWVAIPDGGDQVPVVSFGHGTVGMGDQCAATRRGGQRPHNFQAALDRGWAVAYTDYQGLGTPGLHHYLVGSAEGRAMIDVARSAARFDDRVSSQVVFWGFSQGGHAALFAAELAEAVAPELDVVGTVAVAPAVDISGWIAADPLGERHFLAMTAIAAVDALGLDRETELSPELLEQWDVIAGGCTLAATVAMAGVPSLFAEGGPSQDLIDFFAANDPGVRPFDVPVLLATSDGDGLLRPQLADEFAAAVCSVGNILDRIQVEGFAHLETFGATQDAAIEWMRARFDSEPTTGTC